MPASNKPPAFLQGPSPTPSVKSSRAPGHAAAEQQSLLFTESGNVAPRHTTPASQLWLCIHLPALALQVFQSTAQACAVFEDQQGIRKVLLANTSASSLGIVPGLSANAALALAPALLLLERNPQREAQVLRKLAAWTEKFTSFTCIAAPSLLLLEIAGSLKLFGGLEALRCRIDAGLKSKGLHADIAIAPTPLAATWFARAGASVCIKDTASLAGSLATLPLACLDWAESITESLRGMGISSVGECLRLPRQGFAKRFGACRLLELDRALGRLPDPRISYRAPERFSAEYEFNEEQSDSTLLLHACGTLLEKLESFLLTRQVAVQHLDFSFFHLRIPATRLTLGCVQADRAVQHWLELLRLKLERLHLDAPVIAIQLHGGRNTAFTTQTAALPFNEQAERQHNTSITHLAERLGARMGEGSIHGVMTVAEYRPQYAWRRCDAVDEVPHCAAAHSHQDDRAADFASELQRTSSLMLRRPLWVLQEPRRLATEQDQPVCEGVLQLLDGPERLETGWWDGNGIARDYFIARNPQGVHLWVYRDRHTECGKAGVWYLEGMFG